VKVLFGSAFRNPNLYEMFYEGNGALANTELKPETLRTAELALEHFVSNKLRLSGAVFRSQIRDLISQTPVGDSFQHRNLEAVRSTGAGLDAELRLTSGTLARASYTFSSAKDSAREWLTNSPRHLALFAIAIPSADRRISAAAETIYTGARLTANGREISGSWMMNLNALFGVPTARLRAGVAVRNVLDARYAHPVGLEFAQDAIEQDGRTLSVKAIVRF
jgi:outer membrane cobalamin receptor